MRKKSPSVMFLDMHVEEIKTLLKDKASLAFLARKFKVSFNTMKKYVDNLKCKALDKEG